MIIYLYDANWNLQQFQYANLSDLKSELEKRKIVIFDGAKIGNGAKIIKSIFITGSKHSVNWYGTGVVHIGCKQKSIQEWLDVYDDAKRGEFELANNENYNNVIDEYYGYVLLCKTLQETIK